MKTTEGSNIYWHKAQVGRREREVMNGNRGVVLWFTGLSGAGKSTLAHEVEVKLHRSGCRTHVLAAE